MNRRPKLITLEPSASANRCFLWQYLQHQSSNSGELRYYETDQILIPQFVAHCVCGVIARKYTSVVRAECFSMWEGMVVNQHMFGPGLSWAFKYVGDGMTRVVPRSLIYHWESVVVSRAGFENIQQKWFDEICTTLSSFEFPARSRAWNELTPIVMEYAFGLFIRNVAEFERRYEQFVH